MYINKKIAILIGLIVIAFSIIDFLFLKPEYHLLFILYLLFFTWIAIFSLFLINMLFGSLKADDNDLGAQELAKARVDCAKEYLKISKSGSASEVQWLNIIKNNGK